MGVNTKGMSHPPHGDRRWRLNQGNEVAEHCRKGLMDHGLAHCYRNLAFWAVFSFQIDVVIDSSIRHNLFTRTYGYSFRAKFLILNHTQLILSGDKVEPQDSIDAVVKMLFREVDEQSKSSHDDLVWRGMIRL
jgi:hypothetical protein